MTRYAWRIPEIEGIIYDGTNQSDVRAWMKAQGFLKDMCEPWFINMLDYRPAPGGEFLYVDPEGRVKAVHGDDQLFAALIPGRTPSDEDNGVTVTLNQAMYEVKEDV